MREAVAVISGRKWRVGRMQPSAAICGDQRVCGRFSRDHRLTGYRRDHDIKRKSGNRILDGKVIDHSRHYSILST